MATVPRDGPATTFSLLHQKNPINKHTNHVVSGTQAVYGYYLLVVSLDGNRAAKTAGMYLGTYITGGGNA